MASDDCTLATPSARVSLADTTVAAGPRTLPSPPVLRVSTSHRRAAMVLSAFFRWRFFSSPPPPPPLLSDPGPPAAGAAPAAPGHAALLGSLPEQGPHVSATSSATSISSLNTATPSPLRKPRRRQSVHDRR